MALSLAFHCCPVTQAWAARSLPPCGRPAPPRRATSSLDLNKCVRKNNLNHFYENIRLVYGLQWFRSVEFLLLPFLAWVKFTQRAY